MTDKCVELIEKKKPTFIVILGDTLHYHGETKTPPFKAVYYFIERVSNVAPVYILIGNHDYINPNQYLTDNHLFLPYRKWPHVTVVDRPVCVEYEGGDGVSYSFVMCPYVPPGSFEKALNELIKTGEDWQMADCIFAHQEFRGCIYGAKKSTKGDPWDSEYPPVISGHIHDAQKVGTNIYYTGTPVQHTFGEKPDKKVWFVSFGELDDPPYFKVEKLDLGMKGKKTIKMEISEAKDFDLKILDQWEIKLVVLCSSKQFQAFRQGKTYAKFAKAGMKVTYEIDRSSEEPGARKNREEVSYPYVLREVVEDKTSMVQKVYTRLKKAHPQLMEVPDSEPALEFVSSETDSEGSEFTSEEGSEFTSEEGSEFTSEPSSESEGPWELVFCED